MTVRTVSVVKGNTLSGTTLLGVEQTPAMTPAVAHLQRLGFGLRVQGSGFRVQGLGFRV